MGNLCCHNCTKITKIFLVLTVGTLQPSGVCLIESVWLRTCCPAAQLENEAVWAEEQK